MIATFQSINVPPERHADRVIAEMLRELAKKRALIRPAIVEAVRKSRDGGPRAQRRMAERIEQAGALRVMLLPGTRGRYKILICQTVGWNPVIDSEIGLGDLIPDKPWLTCLTTLFARRERRVKSVPMLYMTHHAVSRCAQRFGLRTPEHIIVRTQSIWFALLDEFEALGAETFFAPPPQGRRVQIDDEVTVVVQRHRTREAIVVVTIVPSGDGPVGN